MLPKRVNIADGEDLVKTSACNYYQGVTQQEAEDYYAQSVSYTHLDVYKRQMVA